MAALARSRRQRERLACPPASRYGSVATGSSTYLAEPGGAVREVFDNCFVMRFDQAGRCREFTEWYIRRPHPEKSPLPPEQA